MNKKLLIVVGAVLLGVGVIFGIWKWHSGAAGHSERLRNYCSCVLVLNRGEEVCSRDAQINPVYDRATQSFQEGGETVRYLGSRLGCAFPVRASR